MALRARRATPPGPRASRPAASIRERLGIFWGSGMAGAATFETTCRTVFAERRRMRPTSVVTTMPNAPVAELALHFGARGAALAYACACASSAVAIGEAMRAIRAGWIDVAIAGGSESMLTPGRARELAGDAGAGAAARAAPTTPPRWRPAAGRSLPSATASPSARRPRRSCSSRRRTRAARGARAAGVLAGYATNCDGVHITQPDAAGQARAMRAALADAGLAPSDIGYLNAHGTATTAGDAAEAESIAPRVRPARRAGELDQGDPRPPARRRRRGRAARGAARARRRAPAADGEHARASTRRSRIDLVLRRGAAAARRCAT